MDVLTMTVCGSILCGPLSHTPIMPPPQFDQPYTGKIFTTIAKSRDEMRILCKKPQDPYGLACSYRYNDGNTCWIIMAPEAELNAEGLTTATTLRHELGHCNGWSGKHEGSVTIDWSKEPQARTAKAAPPSEDTPAAKFERVWQEAVKKHGL
jgi:hypothetical protein